MCKYGNEIDYELLPGGYPGYMPGNPRSGTVVGHARAGRVQACEFLTTLIGRAGRM